MKYDENKLEYYIDKDDVVNNTFYSADDLGRVFGKVIDKNLKVLSHAIYRLIYDYYKGVYKQDHILFMRTKIANNTNGERTYLQNAMIELARGAIESGMDLSAYVDNPKSIYPDPVYEELRNGYLLDARRKINAT